MPLFGRIGRPGLLGTAARTAVIAGTATATAGAIRRHQYNRAQSDYEAEQYERQRAAQAAAPAAGGVPPGQGAQAAGGQGGGSWGGPAGQQDADGDLVDQLGKLAELHRSGALSDQEFAAAKAKLVG